MTNKAHRKCLNTETCELNSPDQRKSMFKNSPFRGRFYTNGLHFYHGPMGVKHRKYLYEICFTLIFFAFRLLNLQEFVSFRYNGSSCIIFYVVIELFCIGFCCSVRYTRLFGMTIFLFQDFFIPSIS